MDPREKEELVRSFYKGMKKERSYEEKKKLKEVSRRHRAEAPKKSKKNVTGNGHEFDEDLPGFEKLKSRSGKLDPRTRNKDVREGPVPNRESVDCDLRGVVLTIVKDRIKVVCGDDVVEALLAPALRARGRLAVGDDVGLVEVAEGVRRVEVVLPRRSVLSRLDPANPHRERPIVANIDIAFVVLSGASSRLKTGLFDRMAIAIEAGGARAALCLNKIDLVTEEKRADLELAVKPYRGLGYPCLFLSATTGEGIAELRDSIPTGGTCVFVGQSGVGKSSLLNRLDPEGDRQTREVRASDGKGRHTTTSSTLVEISNGAKVIDTPGIRAFSVGHLDRRRLGAAFPEFVEPASRCRFTDCSHRHQELDCGVRQAVSTGEIARARYEVYLRIWDSL